MTPAGQPSQNQHPENPYLDSSSAPETEKDSNAGASESERIPRPLSPTKLLPFISNPYRHQSDVDLEALRKKLYNAPRPLKKRSSITEPEGPCGPNIQKLLYQKTTLAAMETTVTPPGEEEKETLRADEASLEGAEQAEPAEPTATPEMEGEDMPPPPPPLSSPPPQPDSPPPPPPSDSFPEDFPPYPPPPYPSGTEHEAPEEDAFSMKPPEVTGQVPSPPASALISLDSPLGLGI